MDQKNQKDSHERNACLDFCVGVLAYLSLCVAFGVLLSDSSHYAPCSTTSSSYQWSRTTFIFLVIGTIYSVVVSPLLRCIILKYKDSSPGCIGCLSTILMLGLVAIGVFSLVCFGGLCYAYGENEQCGNLNNLILAYIIIVSIGLGLGVVGCMIAGCIMCCFGAAALAAKNTDMAEQLNTNNQQVPTNPDVQVQEQQNTEPVNPEERT